MSGSTPNLANLKQEALTLCWQIEKLPAGDVATDVSVRASNLHSNIERFRRTEECGWLIENTLDSTWWAGRDPSGTHRWTKDSLKAVRFSRAEDCHVVIPMLFREAGLNGMLSPTQHVWVSP